MGKYAGRQLGNNFSQDKYMGYSVTSIMSQNIAGMPLAGADICGFFGNATADLCARWYTVGAFYPFSRNHNNLGSSEQEPFAFDSQYTSIIRASMVAKLSLIKYYHSSLLDVHMNGGVFYQPLFFQYPNEVFPDGRGMETAYTDQ
jgi:lysosomal alpha-glucosidase